MPPFMPLIAACETHFPALGTILHTPLRPLSKMHSAFRGRDYLTQNGFQANPPSSWRTAKQNERSFANRISSPERFVTLRTVRHIIVTQHNCHAVVLDEKVSGFELR
jgi:hypothetical protein